LALGDTAEAAKGIQRALGMAKRPDVLLQQAILKTNQKDTAGARQSLEEALKLNPEDINALNMLVQTYTAQNQKAEALQRVRAQAKQRPNSARLQLYLGDRLMMAGDLPGARQAFTAAKTASPGSQLPELALGQLDLAEGKLEDARRSLSGVIARNPSDIRARLLLASLEEKAGQYVEAVEHYRKIIELDDRNVIALNNLAYMLAEHTQMPDEALKYAEKAQEIAPESAVILDTLGWAYYRKGIYTRAIQYLEQATSKDPTGLRNSHLGAAYIKSGDRKRGMALIESAMAKDPKLQETKSFQNIMSEIR
jgi:tetratricopeptide (TPR) repeat protein